MKNLIALIKSDNWLMVLAFGAIASFIGIIWSLAILFPKVLMTILIVLGVSVILGGIFTGLIFWWMSIIEYKVEEETNDDRVFYQE